MGRMGLMGNECAVKQTHSVRSYKRAGAGHKTVSVSIGSHLGIGSVQRQCQACQACRVFRMNAGKWEGQPRSLLFVNLLLGRAIFTISSPGSLWFTFLKKAQAFLGAGGHELGHYLG